jgi:hypothetical protein
MESINTGAEDYEERKRKAEERRKAIFDKIRQDMGNAKPITREELERKIVIIRENNRKRREERERDTDQNGQQTPPDTTS